MDQNQPLKKRIIEQPLSYQQQRVYVKPLPSHNQEQPTLGQYYQYLPIAEAKGQIQNQPNPPQNHVQQQPLHQQDPNGPLQGRIQQQIQPVPQIIHYEYYEPPMTLNAWTQTNPDDFPNPPPSRNSKTEAELLAKIEELHQSLKAQADIFSEYKKQNDRSPSPEEKVSNSNKIVTSEIKHEGKTYRILNQSNDANSETQIEIELSDDAEASNLDVSPPNVYTLHTSPPPITKHIYNSETVKPIPKPSEQKSSSMVSIGPNDTKIPAAEFERISWASASIATRKLLRLIFDRETLATHSMTGKASPAFKDLDKPVKGRLDPNAIQDVVHIVSKKCQVSAKEVRSAITTKCADENKMLKLKEMKRLSLLDSKRSALSEINKLTKNESNKENS